MQYKAIFDIPDDIVPPSTVGFGISGSIKVINGQGITVDQQVYTAVLMPIKSKLEDGKFKEIKNESDN
jgi:hypothetical protein